MIPLDSNIFPQTQGTYITGGSIRDILLDRVPTDYDIAVTENPERFAKEMANSIAGHFVKIGKPGQTIFRVVSDDNIFDISSLNGMSIEEDLKKRDFTINAMAYALSSGKIIDCFDGSRDLANKKIRMVSKEVFVKDPIRLIRAFRLGACLDFDIAPKTISAIRDSAALIQKTAGERIRAELLKMLRTSKSHYYINKMDDTGLLTSIFPDIGPLKGCIQNRHHLFDVFEHTMRAYYHLESILDDPSELMPNIARQISQCINKEIAALLKCSILLHDIGKPSVRTKDNRGEYHFYGHAKKSAEMSQKICQRLKFSNHEKQFLDFIIRNHLKPLFFFAAHNKKALSRKASIRFYTKYADNIIYLLLHTIADIIAKQDKIDQKNQLFLTFVIEMIHDFFYNYKPNSHKPPLITGYDLINEFGLTPSPLFKKILNLVEEAKLTNKAKSRSDALVLVKDFLKKQP